MVVTVEIKNQCLTPKVIFKATVVNNSDNKKQIYFGAWDTSFKELYCNHTRDFNHNVTLNRHSYQRTFGS